MANRYWVGGSGTWSTTTTNWSATNGGASGATAPTSVDDVFVTSLSGSPTITMSGALTCKSITTTGATCAFSGGATLTVSGGITLSATTTWGFIGIVTINATGTITTNGVSFNTGLQISGAGITVTLGSAYTSTLSSPGDWINLSAGTFNTANFNMTLSGQGKFNITGTGTRSLTLGTSIILCTSTSTAVQFVWDATTTTGLTFSGASSSITVNNSTSPNSQGFSGGSLTYGTVNIQNQCGSSTFACNGTNSFTSLTLVASSGFGILVGGNQTVSGTFSCSGAGVNNRLALYSSVVGTPRTISAATTTISNIDLRDIIKSGAATWTGTSIGNAGGNSGTGAFTTAKTVYWNAASATAWNSASAWATSAGGAVAAANYPLPQDTVIFSNTGTTNGMTIAAPTFAATFYQYTPTALTGSSLTNTITFPTGSTWNICAFTTATAITLPTPTFYSRGTQTITGISYSGTVTLNSLTSSTFQLGAALSTNAVTIALTAGTFNLNGFDYVNTTSGAFNNSGGSVVLGANSMSLFSYSGSGAVGTRSFAWGTGSITCSSSFAFGVVGITFTGTPTIILSSNTNSATLTFSSPLGYTYNSLTLAGTGTSQIFALSSTSTVTTLSTTKSNAFTMRFNAGSTFTVSNFNITGTAGNVISITSSTPGTQATLAKAGGGTVTVDYFSIQDSAASPGSTWFAGANSTNVSNNTGWTFTGATSPSNYFLMF